VVHCKHFTALAVTPVAVIPDVTSQELGKVTTESEIENKTSDTELPAETTSAGKLQQFLVTRILSYLRVTDLRYRYFDYGRVNSLSCQ